MTRIFFAAGACCLKQGLQKTSSIFAGYRNAHLNLRSFYTRKELKTMLLFSRFCGLILVLSVVCVFYGCERAKPVIAPISEPANAPSNLFAQLPQCINPNPAIPLTTPKRVFLLVNIDVESLTTYEDWAVQFAEHSEDKVEIDLWRGREDSRERGALDWRFADVHEMCTYFEDARVRRDLEELTLISNAIALSTDILTLTEASVVDNNPSTEASSLIIYELDYPLGDRAAYLQSTLTTENLLASQPEVLRMEVYENFYPERSPNRVIVVSFESLADREAFEASKTVADAQRQISERAAKVWVSRFSRLSLP